MEPGDRGKIVAIDIESEAFEVANDTIEAANRLLARQPAAQIWFVRIGHRGVHRFGLQVPAVGEYSSWPLVPQTQKVTAASRLVFAEPMIKISAVVDTGFSGYLTLPESVIARLGLDWLGRE